MEASPLSPRAFVEDEESIAEYSDNDIVQRLITEVKDSKAGIVPFSR